MGKSTTKESFDLKTARAVTNNDVNVIFNGVTSAVGNVLGLPSYVFNGYRTEDIDLSGSAIFSGQNNDANIMFNTVTGHPRNPLGLTTYVIREQLP